MFVAKEFFVLAAVLFSTYKLFKQLEKFNVSKVIIRFVYFELENKINGICSQDYLRISSGKYYNKLLGKQIYLKKNA